MNAKFNQLSADTSSRMNQILDKITSSTNTSTPVYSGAAVVNAPVYNGDITPQVAAARKIGILSDTYKADQKQFEADGVVTPEEQNVLNSLHSEANIIGTQAGFGDGGADGSGRKIPDAVKQAAGLS